jgi:hypothetical protein
MEYMKLLRAIISHHEYIANGLPPPSLSNTPSPSLTPSLFITFNTGKYKNDSIVEVVATVAFQDYDRAAAGFAQDLFESLVDNKS